METIFTKNAILMSSFTAYIILWFDAVVRRDLFCLYDTIIHIADNHFDVKTLNFRFESDQLIFQLDSKIATSHQSGQQPSILIQFVI